MRYNTLHYLQYRLGLADAHTQTTPAERDALAAHATGRRVLAEIGVWHGVTTRRLRAVMAADAVLYAIDPYPPGLLGVCWRELIAHREVGQVAVGQVRWVRATGCDTGRQLAAELAGRVDFLFIDGDHSYDGLRGDWEAWAGLIAPGGVVGLHDSRSTPERPIPDAGSVQYTSAVIRADERFTLVDEIDSLTLIRRKHMN